MFGRLFGFLAIIRSGRLRDDSDENRETAVKILNDLVDLLGAKGWIREVVVESMLELVEVRCLLQY